MTILISSTQSDLTSGDGFGSLLRDFGGMLGQPDLFSSTNGVKLHGGDPDLAAFQSAAGSILERLYSANQEVFDKNFVGSGRQVIAGGATVAGGKISPLEDAAILQVTNQTPNLSVLVKKRAFSSLNHLYDPTLMDDAELWLFRATKRLFARKCAEVADYERLAKIKRLLEAGSNASQASIGLVTGLAAAFSDTAQASTGGSPLGADSGVGFFSSMRNLQKAIKDRQPVDVTTWFYDPDVPFDPAMGSGSGVFEITLVASLNTNLSIDGSGNGSFSMDNPYNILRISENDIEMAIRDTALSKLTNVLDKAAGLALSRAQVSDAQLTRARKERKRSPITFTVSASGQGATGTMDAIGMTLTADNLNLVPEPHSLDDAEKTLVKGVLAGLEAYSMSTRRNLLDGLSVSGGDNATLRNSMSYARRMLRKFHAGKLLIQPMDTVYVFIDGSTRRSGEVTGQADSHSPLMIGDKEIPGSTMEVVDSISESIGLQDTWQIDKPLLKAAWDKSGKWLSLRDFEKLYAVSGGSGTHVFAGLVSDATNTYNAEGGRYEVSVSVNSNMEWLRLSRYNQQPALQQTEGIIWDPLTPFDFQVDEATGLPTGRAKLTDTNKRLLDSGALFIHRGKDAGKRATESLLQKQDVQPYGGSLLPVFEMPPGLKYRWKEGIITAAYTASAVNPLDPTMTNENQLRRDIGFFASNTAFDTMDAANIVSLLVTGYPHNTATFIESALNSGGFQLDTTLNSGKDYFHSFLDVQKSVNLVQGNFSPFKIINANRKDLAQMISTQQRLTQTSAQLKQLKNQYAQMSDQLTNLTASYPDENDSQYLRSKNILYKKRLDIAADLQKAEKTFNNLLNNSKTWRIAGDDIGFDLTNPSDEDEARLFGDRFLFVSQRRREDVIYNRDKNFLIVSEEYDKDYDIQAFALKMRDRLPDMWKNRWDSVEGLCKQAAEMLDLEFFCNTQGHLELRPPLYNRTPLSVLSTMLSLNRNVGVKLFPDFLTKLVSSRTQSLILEIMEAEYEMMRYAALLGATDENGARNLIFQKGIADSVLIIQETDIRKAILKNEVVKETEQKRLQEIIAGNTVATLGSQKTGIFSASAQANLFLNKKAVTVSQGSAIFYSDMVQQLVKLTGRPLRSYPSFDEAKVGAKKNGQSNPASDVAAAIDRISEQVSRRSKLLRVLEKVLEQSVEIASVNAEGKTQTGLGWFNSTTKPSEMFERLVENDTQHVLGHLSGHRFIIGDENLISYRITEKPPAQTVCTVSGSADALAGVQEGFYNGALPAARAFGADFDLWRQYGFRGERNFDKPYFYDSELQCAPYAKMVLTRQHKEILNGEAEVVGNEFYQLGDVVYLSDAQLLFYVNAVRHSFTYESGFSTTLSLSYGHPVGEYIPTPLDVIGKSLSNQANLHTGFRVRRQPSRSDRVLGVVRFASGETGEKGLLGGQDGQRNYAVLSNVLQIANRELDFNKPDTSPRVFVLVFGNASNKDEQLKRAKAVQNWLAVPVAPGQKSDGLDSAMAVVSGQSDLAHQAISSTSQFLAQLAKDTELGSTDKALLKAGVVASDQAWTLDPELDRVVEIRLRPAPAGGWPQGE